MPHVVLVLHLLPLDLLPEHPCEAPMSKQQGLVYLRVVGSNLAPQDRGWCPELTQLVTSRLRHGTGRHWQFTWSLSPSTPSPVVLLLVLAGMVDSWVGVGEEGKVLLVEIRLLVKMVTRALSIGKMLLAEG